MPEPARQAPLEVLRAMAQAYPKDIDIPLGMEEQPNLGKPVIISIATIRGPFNRQRRLIAEQIMKVRNQQSAGVDSEAVVKDFEQWSKDFPVKSKTLDVLIPRGD